MRRSGLILLLLVTPGVLWAQASQFGVRGLGFPGRALAVRSQASAGGFGLFDPESSQNPAALTTLGSLTSVFTISQNFRTVENPAGTANLRGTRFPQLMVGGPIKTRPAAVGFSYSNYTNRDFTLVTASTIDLREVPVNVTDTLSSRGGLSDFRIAGAYRLGDKWAFGGAFHVISGSNRLTSTRIFEDAAYLSSRQRTELSYAGVGVSVGVTRQFGPRFAVAGMFRSDGHVNVDRDSTAVGTVDLPYSFGLGMRWSPAAVLNLGAQAIVRTWSGANSDLLAAGGNGAQNTIEVAMGAEYNTNRRQPSRQPIRFGGRYATMAFPLVPGEQGHEFGLSLGSGLSFAQQRAGIDVSLEHVWRSEGVYSERAFLLSFGISVRP